MASRHPKTTMFLNFSEELEWPQFPKLRLLRRQNFLKVFLPFRFRLVLFAGLGPWGRSFPRQHTAALCSPQRPRCGRPAAHRGQGGSGCEDERRLWPRTKDFWEENPLEAMGSLREEVDEMLICCGNCFFKCFDGVPG